jgi:hypothetical protein
MAVVDFTVSSPGNSLKGSKTITWVLTGGDTGTPFEYAKFSDKTAHVFGTFNGGALTMEGSNEDVAATNWATLTDNQGADIVLTTDAMKLIAEDPRVIRPSAGALITSVTIAMQVTEA